jgi:hypothetical protein
MDATTQLSLIEGESDEAMLVPREVAAKRYTAATADKLEARRNHILDLLAFNLPINFIAERTGCNHRIVSLIGAKHCQVVATNAVAFAGVLKAKAAKFLFFAEQKAPDAKFGELMVGVGIATQRAEEMEARAAGTADLAAVTDVEVVNERAEAARKWLANRKPLQIQQEQTEATEV